MLKKYFWQTDRIFNLAMFRQLHLVNNGWPDQDFNIVNLVFNLVIFSQLHLVNNW